MILYHGSNVSVEKPRVLPILRGKDFGLGFYTTSNYEQAVNFTEKVVAREQSVNPNASTKRIVSVYEFDEEAAKISLKILRFPKTDKRWLLFCCDCRNSLTQIHDNDMVIGGVANDKVFPTIRLYEKGQLSIEDAIKKLKVIPTYDQYVFSTEKALGFLKFVKTIEIGGDNE